MIFFKYKDVQVEGESRALELLSVELKKQIDLRIYNERAKEILFDYTLAADEEEIIKVLAEEEERLADT
jgi:hypothetical protein